MRAMIVTLIVMVQSSQSLAYAGIALFLPLIRADLGLTFAQSGMFAVASTATYAAMQIPSGFLADRYEPKRVFLIGAIGVNLLAIGFATLPTFELLVLNQLVSGVFRALMFAPGMLLVIRQFAEDRRATAMGLFVAFGFSSNIFLNTFGPVLVDQLGWQHLLILFAVVGLLLVCAYACVRDGAGGQARRSAVSAATLLRIMRSRLLWICGGIQFIRLAVTMATMAWWPTYLVVEKDMSLTTAGFVLAFGAILTAPANFVGGYVSDRYHRPLLVIAVSLTIVGTTLIGIVHVESVTPTVILVSINQFFLQIYFGPLFDIPIKALGAQFAGSINGFSNMLANVGALFAIFTLGWFKDLFGTFSVGIYLLAGLCAVSLCLTAALRHTLKRRADELA